MERVCYRIDDSEFFNNVRIEPIAELDWLDYSHEASIVLQNCYEATNALCECFADAFESFSRAILKPIEDCFEKMFGDWYVGKDEKHFDGVYAKPKMMEYFKMQPNVCNLNNKIRKARNLL